MSYFDKHLDSDEKIILKRRPARMAFLPEYLLIIIVLLASMLLGFYRLKFWLDTQYILAVTYTIVLILLAIMAIVLIIRVEYKIWSKRYALTTERIMISTGIFSEDFKSTLYNKITDIGLQQTLLDKILNIGIIKLNTAGGDDVELVFEKVSKPFDVKKKVSDQQTIKNIDSKDVGKKVEHYYAPGEEKPIKQK